MLPETVPPAQGVDAGAACGAGRGAQRDDYTVGVGQIQPVSQTRSFSLPRSRGTH